MIVIVVILVMQKGIEKVPRVVIAVDKINFRIVLLVKPEIVIGKIVD